MADPDVPSLPITWNKHCNLPGNESNKMPRKKYLIHLTDEERQKLLDLTRKGTGKARQFKRAMILLKANEGQHDAQIMAALDVSRPSVERIRKRYADGGLEKALRENPRPGQKRKLDGRAEAQLVATARSRAPTGHKHWSLRLLAEKVVESGVVDSISYETIRRVLQKNDLDPWQKQKQFSLPERTNPRARQTPPAEPRSEKIESPRTLVFSDESHNQIPGEPGEPVVFQPEQSSKSL
jgi:transposase